MSKWPDGVPIPKPEKPESIMDLEWEIYLNSDQRSLDQAIRERVEAAMGWKKDDVDDARQIAGLVARAVEKADLPEKPREEEQ